jgi:hypothetical protein
MEGHRIATAAGVAWPWNVQGILAAELTQARTGRHPRLPGWFYRRNAVWALPRRPDAGVQAHSVDLGPGTSSSGDIRHGAPPKLPDTGPLMYLPLRAERVLTL